MPAGASAVAPSPVARSAVVKANSAPRVSRSSRVLRRTFSNPLTVAGVLLLVPFVVAAAWPVGWLPHDPYATDPTLRFLPPFWMAGYQAEYLLGTDSLGRDMFSMIAHGGRFSLGIVSLAVVLSLSIGVSLGLLSGYFGGWLDDVLMRLVDIQLSFPLMVLVIAVVAVLGPSLLNLVLVLGFASWAPYSRIVRGAALSLRDREFVDAARSLGASNIRILLRHVLPNTATPVVIFTTFELARLLLLEAALSFLGLGVQPPTPSWGEMIAEGREFLFQAWWASALPGSAIVATVLAFNLIGDGLRDVLDPFGAPQ
jgi:ABC-type dipeptide/oligopeptide/nickel transport system permease subunit